MLSLVLLGLAALFLLPRLSGLLNAAGSTAKPTMAVVAAQAEQGEAATSLNSAAASAADTVAAEKPKKTPTPKPKTRATATSAPTRGAPPKQIDGIPTILVDELPREAWKTLALIEAGGPFPYRKDGVVFQNRERLLPKQPQGYYHEYTVITPGENDRGARRIITGENDEFYYTDDHYASFYRIVAP
jgi:ribonuclease T1